MTDPQNQLGLMREREIVGDKRKGVSGLFPVSRSTWWSMVRKGKAPAPIRYGSCTFWRRSEVLAMIDRLTTEARG